MSSVKPPTGPTTNQMFLSLDFLNSIWSLLKRRHPSVQSVKQAVWVKDRETSVRRQPKATSKKALSKIGVILCSSHCGTFKPLIVSHLHCIALESNGSHKVKYSGIGDYFFRPANHSFHCVFM